MFYKNKSRRDGRYPWCKECSRDYQRRWINTRACVLVRTKKCTKCEKEKPLEMFYKHKGGRGGRHPWCKECYRDAERRSIHVRACHLVERARERARRKGLPFSLTKERILKALEAGRCEATGIPFSPPGIDPYGPFSPTVDRKVPSLGYTDDNVQIVVRIHNFARGSWGDDILNVYIKHMARRAEEG